VVVDLKGELDLATAPQLRRKLHELIESGRMHIAFDLSKLEFMDSTGLGVFIGCLKRIREREGTLVLGGLLPNVARVFEVTGLDRIFTIHKSLAEIGVE
jgi:anti-sigma B factor antagonist